MRVFLSRGLAGIACGLASGTLLAGAFGSVLLGMAVGAALGFVFALALPRVTSGPGAAADRAMTSAAFGLAMWGAINVILLPLLAGNAPQWTAERHAYAFPALVGWLLFGFELGLVTTAVVWLMEEFLAQHYPLPITKFLR